MKRDLLLPAMFAWAMLLCANVTHAAEVKLTSLGPIAFGEDGVLFVSDPMAAEIYAIETGDTKEGSAEMATFDVADIKTKIAGMLASATKQIQINDLAVNPISGNVYLSVSRGKDTIVLKVDAKSNEISEFELESVTATKTKLPNAANSKETRRGNQRMSSITDIAYINGQVYVAGLSNEEFASNLRAIQYPFEKSVPVAASRFITVLMVRLKLDRRFELSRPIKSMAKPICSPPTRVRRSFESRLPR